MRFDVGETMFPPRARFFRARHCGRGVASRPAKPASGRKRHMTIVVAYRSASAELEQNPSIGGAR